MNNTQTITTSMSGHAVGMSGLPPKTILCDDFPPATPVWVEAHKRRVRATVQGVTSANSGIYCVQMSDDVEDALGHPAHVKVVIADRKTTDKVEKWVQQEFDFDE